MFVQSNDALQGTPGWSHVADVRVVNSYGPDCSIKLSPTVVLSLEGGQDLPTSAERSDEIPEGWVDLLWYRNPDGYRVYRDRMGHFKIYTTDLDPNGRPCPKERMIEAEELKIGVGDLGVVVADAKPVYGGGPVVSSCDGRIRVTTLAHLEGE
jgi:hypothetical protein